MCLESGVGKYRDFINLLIIIIIIETRSHYVALADLELAM